MKTNAILWIMVLSGLLLNCSGDDDKGFVRADGPVGQESAGEAIAEAVCVGYEECRCSEIAEIELTGCEDGVESAWQTRENEAAEKGLMYDGDCVARRINAMADQGCALPEVSNDLNPYCGGETCQIWYGTKIEGEACEGRPARSDCEQGLICLGTCQKPCERVAFDIPEGEVCLDEATGFTGVCADDLVCDSDDGRCATLPTVDEPCIQNEFCAEGLWCFPALGKHTCAEKVDVGEVCGFPDQCTTSTCIDQTCVELPGDGEVCTGACRDGLTCPIEPGAFMSECRRLPGEGETCLQGVPGLECADGLTCSYADSSDEDGVCVGPAKMGESCDAGRDTRLSCGEEALCSPRSCELSPDALGCDQCPEDDPGCQVWVCAEIPPVMCSDVGGLL